MESQPPPPPPPPNGNVLSLVSALSQTQNHELHVQAIQARDVALSSSLDSYADLCLQLAYLTIGCDNPRQLLAQITTPASAGPAATTTTFQVWQQTDPVTANQIHQSPDQHFVVFGQMAGLILKNALLRPPPMTTHAHGSSPSSPTTAAAATPRMFLDSTTAQRFKETIIYGLALHHVELRNVMTSIVADCAVSTNGIQPQLHLSCWPQLMPFIVHNLSLSPTLPTQPPSLLGSLSTIQKMIEDDPEEISSSDLDTVVPLLLRLFQSTDETVRLQAVVSISTCLSYSNIPIPNSLVLQFSNYLDGLSNLATNDPSLKVKAAVCTSLVILLEGHTQYLEPQWSSVCTFMLQQSDRNNFVTTSLSEDQERVCTQACEFWLVYSNLPEDICTHEMVNTVQNLFPQLIPVLLSNMVYSEEQRIDLLAQNEIELDDDNNNNTNDNMKPIFHRSKSNKHDKSKTGNDPGRNSDDDNDGDDDDDDDDDGFDDDDMEWNLRRYAGASLDSLASIYGPEPILPALLPSLEQGLSSSDGWIQEACILALGAIADGCREAMNSHMGKLHPHLINVLSQPEGNNNNSGTVENLPQLKCICAWTIGRYAEWVVDMAAYGASHAAGGGPSNTLSQTLQVLLQRLDSDKHRKVQIACASSLGVFIETAGGNMVPFMHDIYRILVSVMPRYHGKSLVVVFDTLGMMADSIGPAVGEHDLPSMYVPPLLALWNEILRQDPSNQILLSLMESLAAIALACGVNFQPFALETFETSMAFIEHVQLLLTTIEYPTEEDAAPITCAADLLDGLCEGLGPSFAALVQSSSRYGQHFASVLHALCSHQVAGVRMSGLALLGDLARNSPSLMSPALPQLITDALSNLEMNGNDDISASLCNNAAWSIGEICVQCGENFTPLEPFASTLIQRLVALLMGNTIVSSSAQRTGYATEIPGLAENAAACMGRLANVNANIVAADLPRFLLGWCDGMSKIMDMDEKRDAFSGLCKALYANPQSVQLVGGEVHDTISSIIFAIVTWHLPPEAVETGSFTGDFDFLPFPEQYSEVGHRLAQLLRDIKGSVDDNTWNRVMNSLTVKVRHLMREVYMV